MIVKQISTKKKNQSVFQNTEKIVETEQTESNKIDDVELDSEYVNNTDESTLQDDESINSKNDSDRE